ncbi:MAG: hypothetical protein ABIG10_03860, partial [bacterium]
INNYIIMEKTILKIFGTGQITIPKAWRQLFESNTLKAVLNAKTKEIIIKPIQLVELEDTNWISLNQLKSNLAKTNFSQEFKKQLLANYEKSDFYSKGKK